MRLRITLLPLIVISSLSLVSGLFAQSSPPPRPSAGDLREEQRTIGNAYLGDADFQIKRARERLGVSNNRLAQQSGLWALEQLAYAKRRLERHAPKIEEAGGFFGRASESTRKELRDSYTKVRENYVNTEERLDTLAEALKKAGMPILSQTLENVRGSSGDGAVQAAQAGLRAAGEKAQGDRIGDTPSLSPISGGGSMGGGSAPAIGVPGAVPPGALSADGRFVESPEFGRIDLSTGRTLPDGSVAYQSDKGLVIRGRDGKWHLVSGAQLNPDGTVTTADGRRVPAESLADGGAGGVDGAANGANFSGRIPPGTIVIDQNGHRITVDAEFQNGEQSGVKKDYIGGAGVTLVSETKVTRKLVQATGNEWHVNVTPGESRSWNFSIRIGEQKSANGTVTLTLTVDGGGGSGFKLKSWEITDDKGNRASVAPSTSNPAEAVATFAKGGEYTFAVTGDTDWGSAFRVKGQGGVYP